MSVERQTVKTGQVFPVFTEAAIGAYVWMKINLDFSTHDGLFTRDRELKKLRSSHKDLFLFLDQMRHLRSTVMFSQDNRDSYDNGVLFMMLTMQNQYRIAGKSFPTLSEASSLAYFQNLVDIERNHNDIEKLKELGGVEPYSPLLPYSLANLALNPGSQTPELVRVRDTFIINSEAKAHYLCDDEELGRDIMLKGQLANRFGPIMGFVYGATDVYTTLQQFEEAKSLRRKLRVNVG